MSGRRRVLIGWELGGGLGPAATAVALAESFRAHGLEPVLALRDVVAGARVGARAFPCLAAPALAVPVSTIRRLPAALAEYLGLHGYADPDRLTPLLQGWRDLLALVDPHLVVAVAAPALSLTATDRPVVQVAPNGFALPPAKLGFLPIYDSAVMPIHVEDEVFDAVREAQHRLALPPIASVFDLYRGDAAFVCVLPEFDPYAERREPRAVGPLHPLPPPNARPAAALFAYLSYAAPAFAAAVDALGGLEVPVRLFVRDATPALRAWLSGRGLIVDANPAPLHEVLAQAAAVLHEGGVGLAQAALAAGVPQVVVPTGAAGDANFNASVLLRMGSGIAADAASIPAALDRMLEPAQGLKAIAAAHLLVDRLPPASLPRVVESSLALAYR